METTNDFSKNRTYFLYVIIITPALRHYLQKKTCYQVNLFLKLLVFILQPEKFFFDLQRNHCHAEIILLIIKLGSAKSEKNYSLSLNGQF